MGNCADEMAQLGKGLICKHKYLSLISRTHIKINKQKKAGHGGICL